MNEHKRRTSQNNRLLRQVIERLRDYDLNEVVIICNKFRQRRDQPPIPQDTLDKLIPPGDGETA